MVVIRFHAGIRKNNFISQITNLEGENYKSRFTIPFFKIHMSHESSFKLFGIFFRKLNLIETFCYVHYPNRQQLKMSLFVIV